MRISTAISNLSQVKQLKKVSSSKIRNYPVPESFDNKTSLMKLDILSSKSMLSENYYSRLPEVNNSLTYKKVPSETAAYLATMETPRTTSVNFVI
jgi:transcriptional accessory protein Tex/SPT6